MSHVCGTVQVLGAPFQIGPDTGQPPSSPNTWAGALPHTPAPNGTKFVILHFDNVSLPADNRLEVDLGYGTDVFTAADAPSFWTRPVNVALVGGGTTVPIRYITSGANDGSAQVDRYGRGENSESVEDDHDSITNCDPFFVDGSWTEPLFPFPAGTTQPHYDPYWICDDNNPPVWADVRCAPAGDVRRTVARSVGMIVTIHPPGPDHPAEYVSTCSVTLIDSDLVVLAGHCLEHHPFEIPTSSVTFDYEIECTGAVPAAGAVFYKVEKLVKFRFSQNDLNERRDYAVVQLRGAPPLPPIPVRNDYPAVGEELFGVHHPNGAVKKVSPSATGTRPVLPYDDDNPVTPEFIKVNLDVAGGSSGSGVFDLSGNILGVLSIGRCNGLSYSSMKVMMDDPVTIPDPPTARQVMIVLDRSGSMSESASGGTVKMDEARSAASLFVSLLRNGGGNEAGLVSFATTANVDEGLGNVTNGQKQQITDALPDLTPGGSTSIGDGLAKARDEFPGASATPRAILLLTDGMENTPPMIANVSGLSGIDVTAIGFGTESNLDGQKLTDLAQTHNGFYKRAGSGLELHKFFALAFGEIFEAGALVDPEFRLAAREDQSKPLPFHVCGEEAVTIVVGWDAPQNTLGIEVTTPSGKTVDLSRKGIEVVYGDRWMFARIPLPYRGERDGTWHVAVHRLSSGGGEFPPASVDLTYFVNVVARGGPALKPFRRGRRRLYTGDVLNPRVMLQYPDETVPLGGEATVTVRRPNASVGTALSRAGLRAARAVDGDVVPARQATLIALEQSGGPVAQYVEETHALDHHAEHTGFMHSSAVYGAVLDDALVVEGNYTFHARARYGIDCTATRETQWTEHVTVGIDPASTPVTVTPAGDSGGFVVTFTPQDKYGNHVGPGAGSGFTVSVPPGCHQAGDLVDHRDGSYSQQVGCAPGEDPAVVVTQPDRDPVVLHPRAPSHEGGRYEYTVQLLCGDQPGDDCGCATVGTGRYATAVTLVNPTDHDVVVTQEVLPTTFAGATVGRWPATTGVRGRDRTVLPARSATTADCCSFAALLLGAAPSGSPPLTAGAVVFRSTDELRVTVAYTCETPGGGTTSLDVETIMPAVRRPRERAAASPAPVDQRRPHQHH